MFPSCLLGAVGVDKTGLALLSVCALTAAAMVTAASSVNDSKQSPRYIAGSIRPLQSVSLADPPDSDLVKRVPFTALRDKDIGTLQRIVDNEAGVVCYRSYASYSYALSCVKL